MSNLPNGKTDQRKLAAIMFTDMVGYSALAQKNEMLALELLDEHRNLLRPLFPKHGGREIETVGDSFFVEFGSALDAVNCAVEIQNTLRARNTTVPPDRAIRIRIGLHLGDVVYMDEHVHGDGVNIAARIEPLADPEGICISEDVAHQIQNKIDLLVVKLGRGELKNIQIPVNIYRILLHGEKKRLPFVDRLYFSSKKKRSRQVSLSIAAAAILVAFYFLIVPKTTTADRKSIAVLPFQNLSENRENEYFSDGMTEDIIAQLSKIGNLKVISRTSVMQYKNTEKSPRDIGRELDVASILTGSVRRSGNQMRIVAQLIDAHNAQNLWSDTYDEEYTRIFAVQSDVAQKIASALKATISADEKARLEKKGTENLEAYTLYLKGRYEWNERTNEAAGKSIAYYRQAIEADPLFALAHAGLADSYGMLGYYNYVAPKEAFPIAKAEALKALELDSTVAEVHATLGTIIEDYDWKWSLAEEQFKQAIRLNPSYASAHQWYSSALILQGKTEESMREIEEAERLDPLSPIIHTDKAEKMYYARRYDEAIEQYRKTLALFPDFFPAHFLYGLALLQKSMVKEAVASLRKAGELSGSHTGVLATLGYAYALSGDRKAALEIFDELKKRSTSEYVSPYFFAVIDVGLGQKDQAIESLEAAYVDRSNWMIYLNVQPIFDDLRSDPRFIGLLKRMGLQ